ncbi:hypothetical protein [Methanoculleus chikugoensis]|uniref:Uncharacterized protein n=1 Tax=Methanoculleus chikugoensis TaxID=118126 RepID=A0ABM7H986_9EURY|nr:hypothetical protein [Methanoculleus chikugoensis]BBL69278.1 hypothetical protein MchiMG62_24590 [Methanoculleus chikugoensis]
MDGEDPAGNFLPLSEIMQQAISAGAKVSICEQGSRLPGMEQGGFIRGGGHLERPLGRCRSGRLAGLRGRGLPDRSLLLPGRLRSAGMVEETVKRLRAITSL